MLRDYFFTPIFVASFKTLNIIFCNMEQRDYLMDQLNQLLRVLSNTLVDFIGLKNQGKINEGIGVVSKVLQNELGFDIESLLAIPTEKLIITLQEKKQLSSENFEALANILLAMANELSAVNLKNERARNLYSKCLAIYEYINITSSTYSLDRYQKIKKIKPLLNTA